MSRIKFTKLLLHNFLHFHAEINLQNGTTLINLMKQSPEILSNFVSAFKFILNNSDDLSEIRRRIDNANEANDRIFVEAHIHSSSSSSGGQTWIFRKSLNLHDITYELNNRTVTREVFKARLAELGFEHSNTLLIDSQMIYRLAIMDHTSRSSYIEHFCATPELLARYQRAKTKIDDMEGVMKTLVDEKKRLKANEKREKSKVKSLQKFDDLDRVLYKHTQEFQLFQLYHNHKEYYELNPRNIEDLQRALNAVKGDYANTLQVYRFAIENYILYDRLLLESNEKLRNVYIEKFQMEQEYEKSKQDLALMELRSKKAFEEICLSVIQKEIDNNQTKTQELIALKNKLEPSYKEYVKLRNAFNKKNLKFTSYFNSLKKLIITDLCEMKETRKFFQHQVNGLKAEKNYYENKTKALKDESVEIDKEIGVCKEQHRKLKTEYSAKKNLIVKLENASATFLNTKKSNDRAVLEKLQNKFSRAIIGRLCDLFDVKCVNGMEVKHHQILERLGKFANAIVCDSQETADECSKFLSIHQHQNINEVIIPLTKYAETSTLEAVKDFTLPEDITAIPIENFLNAKHPEIHKLLMYLLKPTLVCDTLENLQNVFAAVDMEIKVTSFECHMTYKPGGKIQVHLRYIEQSDFDDETIMLIKENLQACHLDLLKINSDMKLNELKWIGYENKKRVNEYYERMMLSLNEANNEAIVFGESKVESADEIIGRLTSIKGLNTMKDKFDEIKGLVHPFEMEFFKEFLLKNGYNTIDQYEMELAKIFPATVFNTRMDFFNARRDYYEKTKTKLLLYAPSSEEDNLEEAKLRFDEHKELLDKSMEKLEKMKEENETINENMKLKLQTALETRKNFNELERKIESMTEKLCDEFINIQIAIAENFRLLFYALVDCERLTLNNGSLLKLIDIPPSDEIGEDFDLVHRNMEGLEINFERLDNKLKTELNIPMKKYEMAKKLRQLKTSLNEFALDVTGDEEQLQSLTQRLNLLIKETRNLSQDIQDVTDEFQEVKNERIQRFNDCLKVINEEIVNFCSVAMRGKAHGEMKADDVDKPFSSGIFYSWQMENKHEELVNELNLNYEAAFAFLMGLIKYKKQQFVILSDSAKVMLKDYDLMSLLEYLKSDPNLQIVAVLASNVKHIEEHCNYSVMKRQGRCVILPNLK